MDTMLPQLEFCKDLKTSPLSLQAIDVALGLLMYYSCSCSSHGSSEIRTEYQPTRRIMADGLVYVHPNDHDAHLRSQKSTLIKAPQSTLIWQIGITLKEPLSSIMKITFICKLRNIPKCKSFQFFQLNYTSSKQTSSSNILKWFNLHVGWPKHGFSKAAPKVKKPGKMRTNFQGEIPTC